MLGYVARRVAMAVPTIFAVATVLFFVVRMVPGDPAVYLLGDMATPERVAKLRAEMGLDKPLYQQYIDFMLGVLRGDFGRSFENGMPTMVRVLRAFPYTFELAVAGTLLSLIIGIPLGVAAAVRRGSKIDVLITSGTTIGVSIPVFWLALLLIEFFSVRLGLLPVTGVGNNPIERLRHLALPAFSLGIGMAATVARMTRSSMLEVLCKDYITAVRAKGAPWNVTVYKHGLRNAIIPVVTVVGLNFGYLLGGTVLVEYVFGRPGLGSLLIEAVFSRDYPQIQASVFFFSAVFMAVNIFVDILYSFLNPKIRYG